MIMFRKDFVIIFSALFTYLCAIGIEYLVTEVWRVPETSSYLVKAPIIALDVMTIVIIFGVFRNRQGDG